MQITREEQILNFSMNQIIDYLSNEDDTISRCIALRLDVLYSHYLTKITTLQEHNDILERDIDDLRDIIGKYNFLEGGK